MEARLRQLKREQRIRERRGRGTGALPSLTRMRSAKDIIPELLKKEEETWFYDFQYFPWQLLLLKVKY